MSQGGACILSANVFYDLAQRVKISIMSMCPCLWWGHFPLQHFLVRSSRNYGNSFALLWKHKRKCFKLQGNLLKSIGSSQVLHCELRLWRLLKNKAHAQLSGPRQVDARPPYQLNKISSFTLCQVKTENQTDHKAACVSGSCCLSFAYLETLRATCWHLFTK